MEDIHAVGARAVAGGSAEGAQDAAHDDADARGKVFAAASTSACLVRQKR
jgi:hypothetical protein